MEKKNFITLVLGVVGGLLFSLGMCMCLLPEWNMFHAGVGFGIVGALVLLVTLIVYRKMSGRQFAKPNAKVVLKTLYGLAATLIFGLGMCMVMVFEGMMIWGILVGITGIVLLLFLIPMCFGFKKA
ncbi:MAG: hypothetical protein J6A77_01505 [Lachnospiraceae bacterium]|nr:hypothetical protein [Lachnospiraceae bacterium]